MHVSSSSSSFILLHFSKSGWEIFVSSVANFILFVLMQWKQIEQITWHLYQRKYSLKVSTFCLVLMKIAFLGKTKNIKVR